MKVYNMNKIKPISPSEYWVWKNKKNSPYKDFDRFKCNDGTIARLRFGVWVDDTSEVKLDLTHFKELS